MPNCAANSACSSRRSSRSAVSGIGGYPASGGGGSNPTSRRSSAGSRPGSRRESFLTPQDSLDSANYVSASALAASAAQVHGMPDEPGGSAMSAGQSLLHSIGAGVVGAASNFSTVTPPRYRKPFLRPYQHF